ncbi:MAG: ribbon-helix-helix protein, CopG family [Opitutaceae bacterium]
MKTLSVKLPEPMAKWLAAEAKTTRRSRSALVREALELKRLGPANGSRRAKKRTLADALLECGGTFQGPGDLSTNPKYFDDFGK